MRLPIDGDDSVAQTVQQRPEPRAFGEKFACRWTHCVFGPLLRSNVNESKNDAVDAIFRTAIRKNPRQIPVAGIILDFALDRDQPGQYRLGIAA